jgi:hypothetical protein
MKHNNNDGSGKTPEDINSLRDPVNNNFYVFVFPIHNAIEDGINGYDGTRRAWRVSAANRNLSPAYAVGMNRGVAQTSYKIDRWLPFLPIPNRHEFEAPGHPAVLMVPPLLLLDWGTVINMAMGYWQFGNYLIVEINAHIQFRFIKGHTDKVNFHPF